MGLGPGNALVNTAALLYWDLQGGDRQPMNTSSKDAITDIVTNVFYLGHTKNPKKTDHPIVWRQK